MGGGRRSEKRKDKSFVLSAGLDTKALQVLAAAASGGSLFHSGLNGSGAE